MMRITDREHEVLKMLTLGNPEIAKRLYISTTTVKTHVHSLLTKIDEENRTKAILKALKMGLIELSEIVL